ncbi:MAG: hypothetical protein WCO00_09520 [Rhodospirillaceae bacterium]
MKKAPSNGFRKDKTVAAVAVVSNGGVPGSACQLPVRPGPGCFSGSGSVTAEEIFHDFPAKGLTLARPLDRMQRFLR